MKTNTMSPRPCHNHNPLHEPRPLTPSLSPDGGEGVRRTGEGDASRFMVPMHAQTRKETLMNSVAADVSPLNLFPQPTSKLERTHVRCYRSWFRCAVSKPSKQDQGRVNEGRVRGWVWVHGQRAVNKPWKLSMNRNWERRHPCRRVAVAVWNSPARMPALPVWPPLHG